MSSLGELYNLRCAEKVDFFGNFLFRGIETVFLFRNFGSLFSGSPAILQGVRRDELFSFIPISANNNAIYGKVS